MTGVVGEEKDDELMIKTAVHYICFKTIRKTVLLSNRCIKMAQQFVLNNGFENYIDRIV